jgi:hypothetical protein
MVQKYETGNRSNFTKSGHYSPLSPRGEALERVARDSVLVSRGLAPEAWTVYPSPEDVNYIPQTKKEGKYSTVDPLAVKIAADTKGGNPTFIRDVFVAGPRTLLKKP